VRASSCRKRFVLRAEGGVLIRWACGAELIAPDETAVDVEILAERPYSHHHHHLRRHT
jgi:hypothetical protein